MIILLIGPLLLLISAIWLYFDSRKVNGALLRIDPNATIVEPLPWAIITFFLGLITLPLYLFNRYKLIKKIREAGGDVSTLKIMGKVLAMSGIAILLIALSYIYMNAGVKGCGDSAVKETLVGRFISVMSEPGMPPDLVMAIKKNRIKMSIEQVVETKRNTESKYVECAGNMVISFPQEDMDRASQQTLASAISGWVEPASHVMTGRFSYKVYKQQGSNEQDFVVDNFKPESRDFDRELDVYINAYALISASVKDITASSKNTMPYSAEYKGIAIQSCIKVGQSKAVCECLINKFEQVVDQEDLERLGYVGARPMFKLFGDKTYPGFIAFSQEALRVCKENPTALMGKVQDAPAPVMPVAPLMSPKVEMSNSFSPSFDCAKASTGIEKLICRDRDLSKLDVDLSIAYAKARENSVNPNKVQSEQIYWIKSSRNACSDKSCLMTVYKQRIAEVGK